MKTYVHLQNLVSIAFNVLFSFWIKVFLVEWIFYE